MRYALSSLLFLAACSPDTPETAGRPAAPAAGAPAVSAEASVAAVQALPTPYNAANYENGRRAYAQCRSCHLTEAGAPHRVGPNLHGVIGRRVASLDDFNYSDALRAGDFVWDPARLDAWIADPRGFAPGNRMAYAGMRDETQRRDLIAYLMIETAN